MLRWDLVAGKEVTGGQGLSEHELIRGALDDTRAPIIGAATFEIRGLDPRVTIGVFARAFFQPAPGVSFPVEEGSQMGTYAGYFYVFTGVIDPAGSFVMSKAPIEGAEQVHLPNGWELSSSAPAAQITVIANNAVLQRYPASWVVQVWACPNIPGICREEMKAIVANITIKWPALASVRLYSGC